MNCPSCGAGTIVMMSRADTGLPGDPVRRRRKCGSCGHRFSTIELSLEEAKAVLGAREAVRSGLMQASAELNATLERVRSLQQQLAGELETKKIAGNRTA